jgi:hypothetical protein
MMSGQNGQPEDSDDIVNEWNSPFTARLDSPAEFRLVTDEHAAAGEGGGDCRDSDR